MSSILREAPNLAGLPEATPPGVRLLLEQLLDLSNLFSHIDLKYCQALVDSSSSIVRSPHHK